MTLPAARTCASSCHSAIGLPGVSLATADRYAGADGKRRHAAVCGSRPLVARQAQVHAQQIGGDCDLIAFQMIENMKVFQHRLPDPYDITAHRRARQTAQSMMSRQSVADEAV